MGPECAVSLHVCVCVCDQIRVQAKKGGLSVLLSRAGALQKGVAGKKGVTFFRRHRGGGEWRMANFYKKTTKISNI